jgi:ABC-type nitrate/sulfonate/bicarbonate transport system substrate-binding protein
MGRKGNRVMEKFFWILLATCFFSIPALAQLSPEKVVIAYPSRSIASIDLYIAQDRGFFRQEALDADLVQVRGNIAMAAMLAGETHAVNNVGTIIRAMERNDAPLKIVSMSLKRNLFWLVTRPEIKTISDLRGKVLGTTTIGGSQHLAAARMLRKGGLDPDKDVTVMAAGDVPAQLQSLLSGVMQAAALSPPTVILARDKYKLKILGSAVEDIINLQNGLAVSEKLLREKRDLVKRIIRARTRANRYFWENERGTAEVLAKYLRVELSVAMESHRLARQAFTANGIPTDKEIDEFLKSDAELLKLREPVSPVKLFDFNLQREVNQELGIR